MERRRLGGSGLLGSAVGLGTNNFGGRLDLAGTRRVIDAAIEHGVTFIDTADVYGGKGGSETLIGQALEGKRDQVVLATKFGLPMSDDPADRGGRPEYVRRAVEASLRRLRTDRIDLYQMHRPDPQTPIAETLGALDRLVKEGTVLAYGTSNFSAEQLREAQVTAAKNGYAAPVSAQHHYNLLERGIEDAVLPAIGELGLRLIPYYPLASGVLTGKYKDGVIPPGARLAPGGESATRLLTPANLARVARLDGWARDHGHSAGELAIAWLLAHPEVLSVIASASGPEQVAENARAAEWKLSPAEAAEVASL